MCGISGIVQLQRRPVQCLDRKLTVMNTLQAHRGPDGEGLWMHAHTMAGFAHRRLSIIDLQTGAQPIGTESGNWIVYNGELYNYIELREEIGANHFRTASDTEVVLRAYEKWGEDALPRLRGMFAFAIWDERQGKLFCARDRFGIKPFYYAVVNEIFYFSSEIKALIPFLPSVETNSEGLKDYLTFQYCLHGKTMFRGVEELQPAHQITVKNGGVYTSRYWQVYYDIDYSHTELYFQERLRETVMDSIRCHVRSDVPIGGYVSGGIDSSVVASLAADVCEGAYQGFTGKFTEGEGYDESEYARALAKYKGFELLELDMGVRDFIENIEKIMYHMDQPAAGPGILPQYMVARLAAKHRKVVLGGQGGDEIFGGYARYLVAYFEQCVRAAIDGTADNGNFVVTYQSIIPNLVTLREYKPMLQEFWREGLFDDADKRYFRLVNRAPLLGDEVKWKALGKYSPYEAFREIYLLDNIRSESYFDRMTHFDFKASLPALLQVEDRVCMAHGLESRVPLLDSRVVEMAATMPANVKFKNGTLKNGFKDAFADKLPDEIINRKSKMGFPVPFSDWVQNGAREFVTDIFSTRQARGRQYIDNSKVLEKLGRETKFGRNIWGYLCLEFWQRQFHDRAGEFKKMV